MLKKEGESLVKQLLEFLTDPLNDDKVRDDERKKPTTVEHMKLLRYYLDRKADTLNEEVKATMNERLAKTVQLISQQGCQERKCLTEGGRSGSDRWDVSTRISRLGFEYARI